MGVKERREREKSETRDKILDAARELFATEGYEGVSMRKVAEKNRVLAHRHLRPFCRQARIVSRTLSPGLCTAGRGLSEFGDVERADGAAANRLARFT